jgi:phenylacetate-CoA ligase
MNFWEQPLECMPRSEIKQIQFERLQATLNRVYKNVQHYRETFGAIDFVPEDLNRYKDFRKLPFTTREDLMDNYPYGMFAVPLREVVRLHAQTLSLDKPVVMGFTANDLKHWSNLMARNLVGVGVGKDDVVQVALTFGIVTGPFGIQLGAERIGACVIPMSSGNYASQIKIMRDYKTSTLVSTPTFALKLVQALEASRVDPKSLSLKYGILGSEPWSENTREHIEASLYVSATDAYGLTEVFGPGVAWECPEKKGLHIAEDHFIPEIIDPHTLEPLEEGLTGELVLTTLSKEAFPLIRYRTGDIATLDYEPCRCGRTHCRVSRIYKRCDDVIIMRGTSIIPEEVGKILATENGSIPNYQLGVSRKGVQDELTVLVEISDKIFFDQMKKQRRFVEQLHRRLVNFLGWEVTVKLVEPGAFNPDIKVLDQRQFE